MKTLNKEDTEKYLKEIDKDNKPNILLHACCGPCTCGVYPQLAPDFNVSILYYNPNIYPQEEFDKRLEMLKIINKHWPFKLIETEYDESVYLCQVKGHETDKEGGKRCELCFRNRMEKAAKYAKENGYDIFTTTLSVSPYKNADLLNQIGNELEDQLGIKYLYSNFKKHDGYKESIRISKEFGIYRQNYCGCRFSLNEKDNH
ncbi:MAG: epoxyqueuosine reductase QueH [Gammaproteobacteria bacterium]|nr:epoxyqueuosine reductase QueH [Gammaproteobacteria bacterium]